MKFSVSILEYLGKIENGVLILISITHDEKYYEGTFFYTEDSIVLTVSEDLENNIGHTILEDADYPILIKSILKKIVPHTQIINKIDEVDFNRWNLV